MGAFFTNVHVSLPNMDRPAAEAVLRERITKVVVAGAYRLAQNGETPDRVVVIVPDRVSGWYVILDEESDAMEPGALRDLAASLSPAPAAASISVSAADSDEFELSLYRNGRQADRVHVGSEGGRGAVPQLKAGEWRGLLSSEQVSRADAALRAKSAFAENSLSTFAKLFGWDEELAHLGFSHVDELGKRPRSTLAFRVRDMTKLVHFVQTPPNLHAMEPVKRVESVAGRPLDPFTTLVYNEGGAGRGLRVLVEWSDASARLLEIRSLRLTVGTEPARDVPFEEVKRGSERFLEARLPDVRLAPWPEFSGTGTGEVGGSAQRLMARFLDRARLWASFQGIARKEGKAEIRVFFVPLSNPEKGLDSLRFLVDVKPGP